jgi:serine/threonine-protein kinase
LLWTAGLGTWAAVFWALRHRVGPVTFVERQIAHVWGAGMIAIGLLFFVEMLLDLPVLTLSPVIALVAGMMFFVKAGILSGTFYVQALALFATAFVMIVVPRYSHILFGIVAAACFFVPGLKYYRQRNRALRDK